MKEQREGTLHCIWMIFLAFSRIIMEEVSHFCLRSDTVSGKLTAHS